MYEIRDNLSVLHIGAGADSLITRSRLFDTFEREPGLDQQVQPLADCAGEPWGLELGETGFCLRRRSPEKPLGDLSIEIWENKLFLGVRDPAFRLRLVARSNSYLSSACEIGGLNWRGDTRHLTVILSEARNLIPHRPTSIETAESSSPLANLGVLCAFAVNRQTRTQTRFGGGGKVIEQCSHGLTSSADAEGARAACALHIRASRPSVSRDLFSKRLPYNNIDFASMR